MLLERVFLWKMIPLIVFAGGHLWRVDYQQANICALKGTSVVIPCSFYYPEKEKVQSVKWGRDKDIYSPPFVYDSENHSMSSRFEYTGNKRQDCSFKINKVEHGDEGKFAFRFVTNSDQFTGAHGSLLEVGDLRVSVTNQNEKELIKEGDNVTLSCKSSCQGGQTFNLTWFKDGMDQNAGPSLNFLNISSSVSGNYSCSVKNLQDTASDVVRINVKFGPKNTSVEVMPSEEVEAGSNVTLICSSYANPDVKNFTWFQFSSTSRTVVGNLQEYLIENISRDGREESFLCSATNKHGSSNSSNVTLRVKEKRPKTNVLIFSVVGSVALLLLLVVTSAALLRRLSRIRIMLPDDVRELDVQGPVYANLPSSGASQSQEEDLPEENVVYTTIDLKRKPDLARQMDPPDDDERVIYSMVCRGQSPNSSVY